MFTLSQVSKSYGAKTLFEDVTVQINREDRLGLVGPNGAGKSTLFKLILGQEEPDTGIITCQRGSTVGFLPQESAPVGDATVLQIAMGVPLEEPVIEGMRAGMVSSDAVDGSAAAKAKRILKGLAFRETDFERPARELSGGWVMRAHLARLLVQEPDLLMLDEPTNHLDLETLLWFQEYLRGYPGGIVVISHDREFLNRMVTGILELRQGGMYRYTGNYDEFVDQKEAAAVQQLAAYKNQQKEIDRLMDFVNRFRAKNTKAAQAQSKLKQIARMEKVEAPEALAATVEFQFPQPLRSGQRVIRLEGVHHAYGSTVVYQGIDFELERGDKVVLVGPNGAGKSTLLKLLAGVLPVQRGKRVMGYQAREGYFAQYRSETLRMDNTVMQEALSTEARVTEQFVRSLLGAFLFRDDDVFKKVNVLSGGEKSRLALVKILLDPPNLLLMDEPTTHLDMASIDALVAALSEYTGTLVFISHDVYFIRALAKKVVQVHSGRLTPFAGDYQYYLEKTKALNARDALVAGAQPALSRGRAGVPAAPDADRTNRKDQRRREAEERQQRSRELRARQKRVTDLETRIAAAEKRQANLTAELEKPETYSTPGRANELNREVLVAIDEIQKLTVEWEKAASELHSFTDAASE